MTAKRLTNHLGLLAAALLALFAFGCSGDDDNPAGGANNAPPQKLDQITVALSNIHVTYDCDTDPVGVSQPGDFRFSVNVDTLSDDGSKWVAASGNGTSSRSMSNGSNYTPSSQTVTITLPRLKGQTFRVRTYFAEADASGTFDFAEARSFIHTYDPDASQMYIPETTAWSTYDASAVQGKITQSVNKRDRSYVLGVLTKEGCRATMTYSATFQNANL